ncbi:PEP-CTERM sorting domain-containing protein [Methyloversatilis sp.]|uniref:PEP-CTERM sorting domain-containing protein n=1 Tax=Methyloversatilis sp. TaxID=2569862 RepID=UPI0027B8E392|nr:PEP-CTERM sorting domain-containing protein [Methyloversatilis sp.]
MKLRTTALAAMLAAIAAPTQAGDFTSLLIGTGPGPDGIWGNANDTDAILPGLDGVLGTSDDTTVKVTGANAPAGDKLYLETLGFTTMAGNANIATSLNYAATEWRTAAQQGVPAANAVPRGTYTAFGTLNLLDYRVTTNLALGSDLIGDVYDFVYRDTRDNKLVFGTRFILGQEAAYADDAELNYMYRYGFVEGDTVFEADAAWAFFSDFDLRLYNASRSNVRALTGIPTLDLNSIALQADVNLSEGNPFSGLYLLKTDAQDWKLLDGAIGYYQAGEEGQALLFGSVAGFAPTAPIPEPSEYAMFLAGLGLIGLVARRRMRV